MPAWIQTCSSTVNDSVFDILLSLGSTVNMCPAWPTSFIMASAFIPFEKKKKIRESYW